MSKFTLHDVRWAAEECERQRSGEMSVMWLIHALGWTRINLTYSNQDSDPPSAWAIATLGHLVEPNKNQRPRLDAAEGVWRNVNVTIGGVVPLPKPELLDRLMSNLIEAWGDLSADEWYREFEEVHPFADGNGRVGSILWNLHRDSLSHLDAPPDFWSDRNEEMFELARAKHRADIMSHLMSDHAPKP